MKLELTRAFVTDGYEKEFSYLNENLPTAENVSSRVEVSGKLYNRAGILYLDLASKYLVQGECDRCCESVKLNRNAQTGVILTRELQDEESEGLILADGDFFETDDLVFESILLDLPSKLLCSEDCKGLCPICGQNLNQKKCDCKKQQSPFDILKQEFNG